MATVRASGALEAGRLGEHGRRIFIYRHVRTNRIVYSLTRALDNTHALKQMYFLGKKTVGSPKIRKDLWTPFATVSFPSGFQGLAAYQQLREYAKRHLMEWTEEEIRQRIDFDGLKPLMTRQEVKERHERARLTRNEITVTVKHRKTNRKWLRQELGPALTNQKANSVADLARVMEHQMRESGVAAQQEKDERLLNESELSKAHVKLAELVKMRKELEGKDDEESRQKYREIKLEKMKIQKAMTKAIPWAALRGRYHILNDNRTPARRGFLRRLRSKGRPRFTMNGVKIEWANLFDRSFAKAWPTSVLHAEMIPGGNYWRNTATTAFAPPLTDGGLQNLVAGEEGMQQQAALPQPEVKQTVLARLVSRLRFGAGDDPTSKSLSPS